MLKKEQDRLEKANKVAEIFVNEGIKNPERVEVWKTVALAEALRPKGYSLEMVAKFMVNEKNIEMIKSQGLSKVISAALKAKFPNITAKSIKFNRNSHCPCGSGIKFKKCCIQKI